MLSKLLEESLASLAYGGVGIALMALGYLLVDVITPGKLHELIWIRRNRNASILLASNILGVGTIVVAAIVASEGNLAQGLLYSFAYGVIGLVVMAVAFVLLDLLTPGRLGTILVDPEPHPAVWVSAAVHVAVGAVIAAALS